ncbi:MAG TPA: hypothetical protein VLB85_14995, partial [Acidimicrobiia bacterium]|nr:hypothetical protein [Acidimicrobiia bacterium]
MKPVHLLRFLVFLLIGAALLIAVVPLLVLLNLVQGGSGFGLCPDGIGSCRNPYTAAPELTATLTVALLGIVALIRVLMRSARRLQAEERVVSEPPPPPVESETGSTPDPTPHRRPRPISR